MTDKSSNNFIIHYETILNRKFTTGAQLLVNIWNDNGIRY